MTEVFQNQYRYHNSNINVKHAHAHKERKQNEAVVKSKAETSDNDVLCSPDNQQAFLGNQHNKIGFIRVLSDCFRQDGYAVVQSKGDADKDIVAMAINEPQCSSVTAVAADGIDILVLLLYHYSPQLHDIHMLSQTVNKKTGNYPSISIQKVQQQLGESVCRQLPAIHAIGGCDTTSGIYGIGKGTVLRRLTRAGDFSVQTSVLNASLDDVCSSGMILMLAIYGTKSEKSLNSLRYSMFCNMAASSVHCRDLNRTSYHPLTVGYN